MSKRKSGPSPLPVTPQGEVPAHHDDGSGPKAMTLGLPTITGSTKANEVLTAHEGLLKNAVGNITEVWIWAVGGVIRPNTNAPMYLTTGDDFSFTVTVTHQVTDSLGRVISATSLPFGPIVGTNPMVGRPSISGLPYPGHTVSVVPGVIEGIPPPVSTFEWYVGGSIVGTGPTYAVLESQLEQGLVVRHIVTSLAGTEFADSFPTTVVLDPGIGLQNLTKPYITGVTTSGEILNANSGTWNPVPKVLTYQWYRGTDLQTTVGSSYTLSDDDIGFTIKVSVTAEYFEFTLTVDSDPTAVVVDNAPPEFAPTNTVLPAMHGTFSVGQTITADLGEWQGFPVPTFATQFYANGVAFGAANATSVVLSLAELGKVITYRVTATNSQGSLVKNSLPSAAVTGSAPVGDFGLYTSVGGMETGDYSTSTIRIPNASFDAQLAKGITKFRITLDGSKAQKAPFGPLSLDYMNLIKNDVVDYLATRGGQAVLDLHDFGQRTVEVATATAVFTDVDFSNDWTVFNCTTRVDGVIENTATNTHSISRTWNAIQGLQKTM
jgi:hypothetical protein